MWQQFGSWRVQLADGAPRDAVSKLLASIDAGGVDGQESVRRGRSRHVFRTTLGDGTRVYVKHQSPRGWRDALRALLFGSPPHQEFRNLERLGALGLPVIQALCCAESRRGGGAVLVTRAGAAKGTLREIAPGLDEAALLELGRELGRVVRRLHDHGFWHRDLHVGNVLVAGSTPVLVDVQKVRWLRVPVPMFLRVTDLVRLHRGLSAAGREPVAAELAVAYAADGARPLDLAELRARLRRAIPRRARLRLRSRGQRCVTRSSGFRLERADGGRFVYRRADIALADVLSALERHRSGGVPGSRVDDVPGGPPAEPPARLARRGWGAVEPGVEAPSPVGVREMRGRAGLRAWRAAHAALLRGIETPVPLALVEQRALARASRAWLVTRWDARLSRLDTGGAAPEARIAALGRFLARLHAAGVTLASLDFEQLRFTPGDAVVVLDPAALRYSRSATAARRTADRARLADWLARRTRLPAERVSELLDP